jgi:hypothetical protein
VPRNAPALNAAIHLTDPDYGLTGYLMDPNGQPLDEQSNTGRDLQFFKGSPESGLWTLTLNVSAPVSGLHLREPFRGAITFAPVPVTAGGVPGSPGTKLKRGQATTATIRITNTGSVPKDFFADPRLNGREPTVLLGSGATKVGLPLSLAAQPNWLVPTRADTFGIVAKANVPIVLESSYFSGDPDTIGPSLGNAAVAVQRAPELAPGFYFGLPEPQGPFGPAGLAAGASADLAGIANMNPFDTDVTSSSGDLWQQSVDETAPYSPLTLAPGQSGTITVTFTPSGRKGDVVRGFIDVDTFNFGSLSGDEVTSIPYSYQVR